MLDKMKMFHAILILSVFNCVVRHFNASTTTVKLKTKTINLFPINLDFIKSVSLHALTQLKVHLQPLYSINEFGLMDIGQLNGKHFANRE